jgi:hypothetical protein
VPAIARRNTRAVRLAAGALEEAPGESGGVVLGFERR